MATFHGTGKPKCGPAEDSCQQTFGNHVAVGDDSYRGKKDMLCMFALEVLDFKCLPDCIDVAPVFFLTLWRLCVCACLFDVSVCV